LALPVKEAVQVVAGDVLQPSVGGERVMTGLPGLLRSELPQGLAKAQGDLSLDLGAVRPPHAEERAK